MESVEKCMQTQSTSNRQRENVEVIQKWASLGSFPRQNANYIRGRSRRKAMIEEETKWKPKFFSKLAGSLFSRIILKLHSCILLLLTIILLSILFSFFQEMQAQNIAYILSWKWQIDKSLRVHF